MENILTFAGCSQVVLGLWAMDCIASVPALVGGAILLTCLVRAVRDVLRDEAPPAQRPKKGLRGLEGLKAPRYL